MEMTVDYNKIIGTRVKLIRISRNISQTELAKQIDVTQTHLSNIDNGRAGLTLLNLIKLHKALDCSCANFFVDIDEVKMQEKDDEDEKISVKEFNELVRLLRESKK